MGQPKQDFQKWASLEILNWASPFREFLIWAGPFQEFLIWAGPFREFSIWCWPIQKTFEKMSFFWYVFHSYVSVFGL